MLQVNQIKRLIKHTEKQLDSINKEGLYDSDPSAYWFRKGFVAALVLALSEDEVIINNNPIDKETVDAT